MKIIDVIGALFPNGYYDFKAIQKGLLGQQPPEFSPVEAPPYFCTDLFAITATLLQRSGAYHHVAPDDHNEAYRTLAVRASERDEWVKVGKAWREFTQPDALPPLPPKLVKLWRKLWASRDVDVFSALAPGSPAPDWWRVALGLLCIADEAAQGLGFQPPAGHTSSLQATLINRIIADRVSEDEAHFSFSWAEPDFVCVLPKSRTPLVGCTLRSLSHNLALLPPRGLARAYWIPHAGATGERTDCARDDSCDGGAGVLNCLLVPMPFRVPATSIKAVRTKGNWGWFRFDPDWCIASDYPDMKGASASFDEFWQFIQSLIHAAEQDVGAVHAIVFPEAALSDVVFRDLKRRLQSTNVEMLIAGLFDVMNDQGCQHGNYAALATVGENGIYSYRQKHHRWRLDRSQIQTYALGAALDPSYGWWEDIDILSRSLDVYVLRGRSTVTTLICEDLARHDPCQELVRGIGPNLVFALLMDGPQLKARWPARYATVLAEDPGSSVLSFTSLGLIERSNATGLVAPSRKVGLWRDDRGETIELTIPTDAQALCISLQSTDFEEHTLDGRSDGGCSESWRLTGLQPVRLPPAKVSMFDVILKGQWPKTT